MLTMYPACFFRDADGYSVIFPDLEDGNLATCGENIEEAMDFASKVGALTVLKEGAQSSLPTLKDVENFRG